jgi:penicillin-binding protein 1A
MGRGLKSLVKSGDVFYVEPIAGREGEYRLRQIPEVSGACVAMDPFSGRVLAMVGGFSFDESEFNRATQAQRQPGSSFKPFVYAAAIDNGYMPSSIILDEPVTIDMGWSQFWSPKNFEGKSYGPHTLRFGIEHSIDQMTVRLARDIGMPLIVEIREALRRLRRTAAAPVDVAWRGRDDGVAHDHRLFDVRQRRQAGESDPHRSDSGPLGQYDLQAR